MKGTIVEITRLVTKLLGPPDNIDTSARLSGHVQRWMIFGNQRFRVYVHHSSREDLSLDLCTYPERLISIGLVNSWTKDSREVLETGGNGAAWMVLIARLPHGAPRVARN